MEVELREQRSRSANKTPRLQGPKILRSRGTKVRTIEARVTYQNIGKMAQGSEPGVVTGMVPECSRRVWRWGGVSGVGVEIHGYDSSWRNCTKECQAQLCCTLITKPQTYSPETLSTMQQPRALM